MLLFSQGTRINANNIHDMKRKKLLLLIVFFDALAFAQKNVSCQIDVPNSTTDTTSIIQKRDNTLDIKQLHYKDSCYVQRLHYYKMKFKYDSFKEKLKREPLIVDLLKDIFSR